MMKLAIVVKMTRFNYPGQSSPTRLLKSGFHLYLGRKFSFPERYQLKTFLLYYEKEYPAQNLIVLPWPEIPSNEIENWLELSNGNLVDYLPTGISTVSCVIIGKN